MLHHHPKFSLYLSILHPIWGFFKISNPGKMSWHILHLLLHIDHKLHSKGLNSHEEQYLGLPLYSLETLVVVAQHRNQYYSRGKGHGGARYGSFDTPPSKDFRGINCRTFQSGSGLLPTPPPLRSLSPPVVKRPFSPSMSPKSPSSSYSVGSRSEESKKSSIKLTKTSPLPIPAKLRVDVDFGKLGSFNGELSFSERWAGPVYCNSPPPSSLPIPKFSIRPKRTVSLDLPSLASDIHFHHFAKSAPASPTRERSPSPVDLFDDRVDSATKTLRRIVNLDLTDE